MIVRDGFIYPSVYLDPDDLPRERIRNCGDKECVVIEVSGDEYESCLDPKMWSSHGKRATNRVASIYNDGLLNTDGDKTKTERVSRLGEIAFCKIFPGMGVNTNYMVGGDRGVDFRIGKLEIDLKTAASNYGRNCITVIDNNGRKTPLKSDIYVASFVEFDSPARRRASVAFVGWEGKDALDATPIRNAYRGNQKNKELVFWDIKPIMGLIRAYHKTVQVPAGRGI